MRLRLVGVAVALILFACGAGPLSAQQQAPELQLSFDGALKDGTGHGHDAQVQAPAFEAGQKGQALKLGADPALVPDSPELRLAPGLRIDCWVKLAALPEGGSYFLVKKDEYMLRVDPAKEGGQFAFFVMLGGFGSDTRSWEPRVRSDAKAEAGVWYHLVAAWDGLALTLDVNGKRTRTVRSGVSNSTTNPLALSVPGGLIDELRIDNPRLPMLRVQSVAQEHSILRAGRPEKLAVAIQNLGSEVGNTTASLELPDGITCEGGARDLGPLPSGATKTAEWTVRAGAATTAAAAVRLAPEGASPMSKPVTLAFFPAEDRPFAAPPAGIVSGTGQTYYVDSVGGRNTNTGGYGSPWQDFTNINGKTLGPGDRLLIKRGSVINQELTLSAQGSPERWAEIGAYGYGPRPIIRRNGDIADRCVLVRNPDYLRIRSLVVCYAAKGLMVFYPEGGHQGLVIEDCIAHHIEGLYRTNAHGIPEWRDRPGPAGDGCNVSCGIGVNGARPKDVLIRDCEVFQDSWGFFVSGVEAATIDRVFCHHNFAHNTSPHPAIVNVSRSYLQNSILDTPGWHASAGTMGIMLVNPQGLIIRNCTFKNQRDSGSHDEGGIDFEAAGSGCLIEHTTFENNAGAAIEVLGLRSPQPRNVEVANSRFIKNNVALKLGPAEFFVWGKGVNPEVCCSTGTIHDNGYVLNPGVQFYYNEVTSTTSWTLSNNKAYPTAAALRKAMPFNEAPNVDAGPDIRSGSSSVRLTGSVTDDGKPGKSPLSVRWEALEGPGAVTFTSEGKPQTQAQFSAPGEYLLRLVADDGELWRSDIVTVHILPAGVSVAKAWEFNTALDKEGWTEVNPGTRVMEWGVSPSNSKAEPVKYVAGGYYILAVEESPDAHLLSADKLGVDLARNKRITLCFQNHTPAARMRVRFTTDADPAWNDAKAKSFDVTPNDNAAREYTVDMSGVPGWNGRLKQLRLDLATGEPLTGTCRFDYIWIGSAR